MRCDDSSNRSKFARYNLRPVLHCRREAPSFGDEGAQSNAPKREGILQAESPLALLPS